MRRDGLRARSGAIKWAAVGVGVLLLAPALVDILVFRWLPFLVAAWRSLETYALVGSAAKFVGLENFQKIFTDPTFYLALWNTVLYGLLRVIPEAVVGFAIALFVNLRFPGMALVRTLVFIPSVTSLAVMSVVWKLIYHPQFGLLNSVLGIFGIPVQGFLTDPHQAMPAVALSVVWKDIGIPMIIFLAGLQNVPQQLYEAAWIDGANALQRFQFITVPLLRRTLMYVVVVTTVFAFVDFAPIYVMTQGGPQNRTYTLIYAIYEAAFVNQSQGYANALTVVMFALLLLLTLVQMRVLNSDVEY